MSTRLQRFDFGAMRDFRGPIVSVPKVADIKVELPPELPPAPVFNEFELDAARQSAKTQGYQEGFAAGQQQAQHDIGMTQKEATEIMQGMGEQIATLTQRYESLLAREASELSELVLVIAKKVAGDALDRRSVETVAALVNQCLPVIFSRPRLMIDLHPEALKNMTDRINALLASHGFEGEVQYRGNEELGMHDARLDWISGQANRSTATLWQEIESLLTRIPLELTFQQTLQQTTPGD